MGGKKSGGGWYKKVMGFGKKKSDDSPAHATETPGPEPEAPSDPKYYANPLLPKSQLKDMPLADDPAPGSQAADQPLSDAVLVIDDSEIDRMIIEELLTEAGYQVILAVDGNDGLEKFRQYNPNLVITDMIMPGKAGTELILDILREAPEAKIIAMSAGGELGPKVALVVAESIDVPTIYKPVDPDVLLEMVKSLY